MLATNELIDIRVQPGEPKQQHPENRSDLVETPIVTTIDLDRDGKQDGSLHLYHSGETNGYGYIPIPIVSIKNGTGPTALLIGGNHGNEYEGIVSLMNLARSIVPEQVNGQIIVLPSLNLPAVMAGTRSSPLDGGNLNRCFPGNPLGGPTQVIAHYVSTQLLPRADLVIDLHAGGRSSTFIPCAIVRQGKDASELQTLRLLADWFAAPISYVSSVKGGGGRLTLSGECTSQGIPCLTVELGGGETLCRRGLQLAGDGVTRVLNQAGILPSVEAPTATATRWMTKTADSRLHAPADGIFEPRIELGEFVSKGKPAGLVHFVDAPLREPVEVIFAASGYVLSRHLPALVKKGDELCSYLSEESLP